MTTIQKRILVSVSDKSGLVPFVSELALLGYEIVSTGGTRKHLQEESTRILESLAKEVDEIVHKQKKSEEADELDVKESLQLLAKQMQMQNSAYTRKP